MAIISWMKKIGRWFIGWLARWSPINSPFMSWLLGTIMFMMSAALLRGDRLLINVPILGKIISDPEAQEAIFWIRVLGCIAMSFLGITQYARLAKIHYPKVFNVEVWPGWKKS